jgi:1-acyl-sn-glycerol-3-phosphate acyltransferase
LIFEVTSNERGTDAVVQPVFVDYSRIGGMPLGRRGRPLVAWYDDMTFLSHFWRFLRAGAIGCDVYFGALFRVSPESGRKAIARATELRVRELAQRARRPKSAILAGPGSS